MQFQEEYENHKLWCKYGKMKEETCDSNMPHTLYVDCISACVYLHVCVAYVNAYEEARRECQVSSSIILWQFLRQDGSPNLKHTILARLAGQHTLGSTYLCPRLGLQAYMSCSTFKWVIEI